MIRALRRRWASILDPKCEQEWVGDAALVVIVLLVIKCAGL